MIRDVTFQETIFNDPPAKFEAGTPNVADAVGLEATVRPSFAFDNTKKEIDYMVEAILRIQYLSIK